MPLIKRLISFVLFLGCSGPHIDGQDVSKVADEILELTHQKYIVKYKKEKSFRIVSERLKSHEIEYIEPDRKVHVEAIPNDALYQSQWGPQKISAPSAWDQATNSDDTVVAVLDTGVDYTHPDLTNNLVNLDGGVHGYSCFGSVSPGGADDYGHGTHVAGIIGGEGNNSVGIAGLNWRAKILSMKFLDSSGSGYISDAILCYQKIIELKNGGLNVRVVNNSWGGGGYSQALRDVMQAAEDVGIMSVSAAGNEYSNVEQSPTFPGAYDLRGAITVMATDSTDTKPNFSNDGLISVDIGAPGVGILSTVPVGVPLGDPSGYRSLNGTSMATPHVAGVAAMAFHQNPILTPAQTRDLILNSGSYDAISSGITTTGGRLNFNKVLINPLLSNPALNHFPLISGASDIAVRSGSPVALTTTASDQDGNALAYAYMPVSENASWYSPSFVNLLLPSSSSFTAPSTAYPISIPFSNQAADHQGGSAKSISNVTVFGADTIGAPPTGTFTGPTNPNINEVVYYAYPAQDPQGLNIMYMASGYSGPWVTSDYQYAVFASVPTTIRMRAFAIDKEFQLVRKEIVSHFGGATGSPPKAVLTANQVIGFAPFDVAVSLSNSEDPDSVGFNSKIIACKPGDNHFDWSTTCTYPSPGTYEAWGWVRDNHSPRNYADSDILLITVLPNCAKKKLIDINDDGLIDANDLSTFLSDFNIGIYRARDDMDFDRLVTGLDLSAWLGYFFDQDFSGC